MPLYEYECKQCHKRVEKIQSFSAPPEKVCPQCGGELDRVISAPAIQFKGAGWYINDYAKSGGKSKSADSSDTKSENTADGKSSAATDGKSESKDSGNKTSTAPAGDSSSSSTGNASSAGYSSGNSASSSKSE